MTTTDHLLRPAPLVYRGVLAGRNSWLALLGGFLEPVVYLAAFGAALGAAIGGIDVNGQQVTYAAFIAPALLAASAMNAAVAETTTAFFYRLRFARLYESIVATPMRVIDILGGEILWAALRGALYAAFFLVGAWLCHAVGSPWALAAIPFAFLASAVFAALGTAASSFLTSWEDAPLIQLATVPLLLFSATFYPASVYPGWLQRVVAFSPLYQANVVLRGLFTGTWAPESLAAIGYLLALGAAAIAVAALWMRRHLLP